MSVISIPPIVEVVVVMVVIASWRNLPNYTATQVST